MTEFALTLWLWLACGFIARGFWLYRGRAFLEALWSEQDAVWTNNWQAERAKTQRSFDRLANWFVLLGPGSLLGAFFNACFDGHGLGWEWR